MRCRPGDLAIVIGGHPMYLGRVLTVTTPCTVYAAHWDTDPPQFFPGFTHPVSFADETLQPIRPGAASDETANEDGLLEQVPA